MTVHTAELATAYALGFLAAAMFADVTTMFAIAVVGVVHVVVSTLSTFD